MTDRETTKQVLLQEFVGTALAAAGIAGMLGVGKGLLSRKNLKTTIPGGSPNQKMYINPQNRGDKNKIAGIAGRMADRAASTLRSANKVLMQRAQDRLTTRQSEVHNEIANLYGVKPLEYANLLAGHARKIATISRVNDPVVQQNLLNKNILTRDPSGNITGFDNISVRDLNQLDDPSYTPSPVQVINNEKEETLGDLITKSSRLEILDTVKPAARAAREKAAKSRFSVIGPGVATRQQQTRNKIAEIELANQQAKVARSVDVEKQDKRRKIVDAALRARQSQDDSIVAKFGYGVMRLPGMIGRVARKVTAGKL